MANARVQAHIRPYGTVSENARRIVRARLAELYVWAQYTHDASRAREQHQLRIAAKRLRYTLELFRDFLPEQTGECIKALKNLQDALGLLHDCDVLIAILRSAVFAPDETTPLFVAIPEAQDLPPALLEVLGQRTPHDDAASLAGNQPPEPQKKGKRHKDAKGKQHRRAAQKEKAGRHRNEVSKAEEARSRVHPNREQRAALEQFLMAKAREREDLYRECVKRWDKMEERDFRATVLHLVEEAETPGHYQSHPPAPHSPLKSAQHL
ncbi:MAG TPA: CHAD domain-containing protein [Ktedonobacterales bacterium]|nr:CHAD domain-containing protein [Ktedonobacterales bacterium]